MRFNGCAFWAGWMNPWKYAIPILPRLLPMKHGCVGNADSPKRRSVVAAELPMNSSTGWTLTILRWVPSRSPTSTAPSRRRTPGDTAAEHRSLSTRGAFVHSSALPKTGAGARRAWPRRSSLHGSIPSWHRSKSGDSSLHTRAGLSRGTQCSGSDCPVTQGRASARGLVQRRRGRITEQREPVVDPLSGQTLMGAGPLVPSPAPCAQIEPGTEQVEKALSGALVHVEIGA